MSDGAAEGVENTGDNSTAANGGDQQVTSAAQRLQETPTQSQGGEVQASGQEPGNQQAMQQGQTQSWLDQHIQDPDTREWLASKGYDKANPEAVAKSYRNLEKVFGADKAGRTVVLPGAESSEEERMEIFNRLGRPESPDKYDLPFPENGDPEFQNWAKETFHKAGLTPDQAKAVVENLSEYEQQTTEQQQAQYERTVAQQENDLKTEWGREYDRNMSLAQRAAQSLVPGQQEEKAQMLDAMEKAMGYKPLMEFMSGLGQKLGEDSFIDGGSQNSEYSAKARIRELESNQEFMGRYLNGDEDAVATLRALYREIS